MLIEYVLDFQRALSIERYRVVYKKKWNTSKLFKISLHSASYKLAFLVVSDTFLTITLVIMAF
jgi:hypothetical protein